MKFFATIFFFVILMQQTFAQQSNSLIKQGNDAYAKEDFSTAADLYQKALTKDPKNDTAKFNLANALLKQKKTDDAQKYYDNITANSKDKNLNEDAFYNKGVSFAKDKKLQEAADAFKQSLRLTPTDDSARENLQKVLNELKQQQQQKQNQNQNKQQQQKQKQQQQPQNKNQLTKERAQQLMNNLEQQEKELQKKLQQQKTSPNQQEKDW